MTSQPKITASQALEQLWRRANLSFLLDASQLELYNTFHNSEYKVQTWCLPRRFGKSRTLLAIAIEKCLKKPGAIVKFLSPTKKQLERNIRPLMRELLQTCPQDLKPELKKADDIYYFSNGSELQMAGSESGNIDSLRGGSADICIVDEAQDVSELKEAINAVLLPTTLTTKGKVLLAGTPPKDPDHEFLDYIESAEAKGILIKRTVYDNPRLKKEDIDLYISESGGEASEHFLREYLCKIFKSKTRTVVPEFDEEMEKKCVKEWERPVHFASYTSMDIGMKDWTVVLFGYYDFRADKIVFEDEIVTKSNELHLDKLTKDIAAKENTLWMNELTNEMRKPKKRVSDHDLIVINEIKKYSNYKIIFDLAEKKEKMAGINYLRVLVTAGKVIINPKCKTLISHLRNGKWSKGNKEELAHCPEGSHYDAIPAAVYFVRAIDFKHNPYPKDFNSPLRPVDTFKTKQYYDSKIENADVYRRILGKK